jgi:multidrug transporter EmrE-like cation transporter
MHEPARLNTPWWYWIVVALAIIFAIMGLMQLTYLSEIPDPLWTIVVYGIGQISNFLGAVSLVLRRKVSRWFYLIMAIAFAIHRIWLLLLSGLFSELPAGTPYLQMVAIILPIALIAFVALGVRKNWIR